MHFTKNTLGKNERLKSRTLINQLFEKGEIIHHYPFKVLYQITNKKDEFKFPAQIAVSVSKRSFKKAVDRNHIKRKMREAYRLNKLQLYNVLHGNDQNLYFFVIYTAKSNLAYQNIEEEMKNLLQKIISKLNTVSVNTLKN